MLIIYLLVALHHSIPHYHASSSDFYSSVTERHHNFHHSEDQEHGFHFGLYHLLSHLFDSVDHFDEAGDEHFIKILKKYSQNKNEDLDCSPYVFHSDSKSRSIDILNVDLGYTTHPFITGNIIPNIPTRGPPKIL